MRAVMGDMDLDHTLSQRTKSMRAAIILDERRQVGLKVTRVDAKTLTRRNVASRWRKQMTAERNRAAVLQAEGDSAAAITPRKAEAGARTRAKAKSNRPYFRAKARPRHDN